MPTQRITKPEGPYAQVVLDLLDWRVVDGDETMSLCPLHGDTDPSLRFNTTKGIFHCFGCQRGGSWRTLLDELGQSDYRFTPGTTPISTLRERLHALTQPQKTTSTQPESSIARYLPGHEHTYWTSRGFTRTTIRRFELGADPVRPHVVIPIRSAESDLIGVISRDTRPDVQQRYNYPKNFPRSTLLYGSHLLDKTQNIVLTEGTLDAIKVSQAGFPALAQYGSSVTREQVKLLKKLGVRSVSLFYDCDPTGIEAQLKTYSKLSGILVRRVQYNPYYYCPRKPKWCSCERIHGADPASLSDSEIGNLIENHASIRFRSTH